MPQIQQLSIFNGKLNKRKLLMVLQNWSKKRTFVIEVAGKVEEVLVKLGETVYQGRALYASIF